MTHLIPNNLFFEQIAQEIESGKTVRIRAKGNSMLPFIRDAKDDIILKSSGNSLKKGMIVLAKVHTQNYVIHRIKKAEANKLFLRGDGNLTSEETCTPENVIAKVSAVVRNKKIIAEGSLQWNLFRYLWIQNAFARKILLAMYRRLMHTP